MGAPRASADRWSEAGGNGRRTVSKCAFAITASRNGFGIPLLVRLSLRGEGEHRLDQRLELERGPYLAEETCLALAGIPEAMGGARRDHGDVAWSCEERLLADAEAEHAFEHLEALRLKGVHVAAATNPFGRTIVSTSTDSPFVSSEVRWKTSTSPVTGFSSLSPERIIVLLS